MLRVKSDTAVSSRSIEIDTSRVVGMRYTAPSEIDSSQFQPILCLQRKATKTVVSFDSLDMMIVQSLLIICYALYLGPSYTSSD